MRTIASNFTPYTPGFDLLRLGLAFAILVFHGWTIAHGSHAGIPPLALAAARLILPMFFAMSGFLVAASLSRAGSLQEYGLLRVSRLLPGLFVTVAVTALILGPLLSETGWRGYFSSPATWAYFKNVVAIPTFGLPELFQHNPRPGIVNGSLWTIRLELGCYLLLAPLFLLRRFKALFVFVTALGLWLAFRRDPAALGWFQPDLPCAFLAGAFLFSLRNIIPLHAAWGAGFLGLALLMSWQQQDSILMALPVAYATVWLGLTRPRLVLPGDYAYGVYLAGYPAAQSVVLLVPQANWWLTLAFSAILALCFAILLWHGVEKPVLGWRHRLARGPQFPGRMTPSLPREMACLYSLPSTGDGHDYR